jgi:hypothetical protein
MPLFIVFMAGIKKKGKGKNIYCEKGTIFGIKVIKNGI